MTSSSNGSFGTVAWAQAGNGRMSRGEKLREFGRANRTLFSTAPAQLRMRLGGRSRRTFSFDVERIPVPDSRVARDAFEECREASPERLMNHSCRTYAWAWILGERDGLRPDPEVLYVAALLHDLALTDRHRDANPMPCFGARAGLMAIDWAGERGWPADRARTLGDAISLHLNARVDAAHGPEAQVLQAGAALDVIGLRYWQLDTETIDGVLARYPRGDFIAGVGDFEAEARPGTRAQLLTRWMMFPTLVRASPFSDQTERSG